MAERTSVLRRLAHGTLERSAAVTAVSEDLRERSLRLGADPGTTSVVRLGVDTQAFSPRKQSLETRQRLGATADQLLVVGVGRLIEVKGFRYLIEAVAGIDGAHLAIVGDGPLMSELAELAKQAKSRVTFVGNLDRSDVSDALSAADVVAVPSVVSNRGYREGLPTTLLEAMAAGRPIVASTTGGIPEILRDEANGLLVPEKDAGALAEAIRRISAEPSLGERLGANARATAVSTFDWARTAEAFENVYGEAVSITRSRD